MDSTRSTTIGIGLIMAVFLAWFFLNAPKRPKTPPVSDSAIAAHVRDSSSQAAPAAPSHTDTTRTTTTADTAHNPNMLPRASAAEKEIAIETPLVTGSITSHGGALKHWVLKSYKTWEKKPLDLVNQQTFNGGDVNLRFATSDGKSLDTKDLEFTLPSTSAINVGEHDSTTIALFSRLDSTRYIQKTIHLYGAKYAVAIEYHLVGLQNVIAGYNYSAVSENAIPLVEQRASDESGASLAFAGMRNGQEEVNVTKPEEPVHKSFNGDVDYVATRTQYFMSALIPIGAKATSADVSGTARLLPDKTPQKSFVVGVTMPLVHPNDESVRFDYYLGPIEYERVKAAGVGLENTMNFGWSFLVRPISIHLMLPLLNFIHSFIDNWGLVIIVFSILIKLLTVPLSTGQMKSMRKMQVLQPKVAEVREKHKDDPKKMNEEMMSLYKTYGVNPAGGCLPTLLQMPILFALYAVLRNVIELRQAPFVGWIHDLSLPDALIKFGTDIPLLGNQLSGLTLLLGATMLLQQKFTVSDPRQKSMMYLMPVIFTFMFNRLPSGVALYYFMFNIFGLAQQFYIAKIASPITLESIKVDPKKQKSGGFMAKLQEMERTASEQRRRQMTQKK